MPKRIRKQRPQDPSQWAYQIVKESVDEPMASEQVSKVMAAMGRKGGKIGGKRRLKTMTADERREAASHAARARWGKTNGRKH
jgi:hypothetical protein